MMMVLTLLAVCTLLYGTSRLFMQKVAPQSMTRSTRQTAMRPQRRRSFEA
jgi:hypothetical protein